jgi:hypothetical protein
MTEHSSPDDEPPTARTLREVLDGPVDTKPCLVPHHAKMTQLTAEWLSLGSSDGTCAKSLVLAARLVEEVAAPIALVDQEDASTR